MAANAPEDKPIAAFSPDGRSQLDSMLQPHIRAARASFPQTRARYLAGLPERHSLFITTALRDSAGRTEMVFVAVDSIARDSVYGRIWNEIRLVKGYSLRQPYAFPEGDLLDWTITRPDGTEDGNAVGKFVDSLQRQ